MDLPDAEGASLMKECMQADVTIMFGRVQDFSADDNDNIVKLADDWYFTVPRQGLFLMRCSEFYFEISNGSMIVVDTRGRPADDPTLTTFILGSAFGVIGMQRDVIPIHGAAVAAGNAATIITGFTGSGKSAILSALVKEGYRYLADDVCFVLTDAGKPFVCASYPQRKVAAASARELGEDVSGAAIVKESEKEKYSIRRPSEWCSDKLPLQCIVEIVPGVRENNPVFSPEIRRVSGHASLGMVLRNRYRVQFANTIGVPPDRMKRLLEITSSVSSFQIVRPESGFPVKETARMIAEQCFR